TGIRFSLRLMPQLATGPSFIVSPKQGSITSVFCSKIVPSGPLTLTAPHSAHLIQGRAARSRHRPRAELAALAVQLGDLTEFEGHVAALNEVEHLLHRRRCRQRPLARAKDA